MKPVRSFLLLFYITGILILSSCGENVLPDPIDGEVQFYFDGKIKGESVKWEAGKNDYYMSVNDVPLVFNPDMRFFGKLRIPADSNRNALEIYFENPLLNSPASTDTFFQPRDFLYQLENTSSGDEPVVFQAISSGNGTTTYSWDFGDGTFSTSANVVHLFANPAQEYTVKLNALTTDGQNSCSSEIIQKIIPENVNCRGDFSFNPSNGLEREIQFNSEENRFWDFGDGSAVEYGKNPVHLYSSKGVFTVSAVTDTGQACFSSLAKNIEVGNIGGCGINFQVTQPLIPQNQRVTIIYKDSNGKVFSSRNIPQPGGTFFSVLKSEALTENQQKIKKLTLLFSCQVISNDGEVIPIVGEKVVFAVAIP